LLSISCFLLSALSTNPSAFRISSMISSPVVCLLYLMKGINNPSTVMGTLPLLPRFVCLSGDRLGERTLWVQVNCMAGWQSPWPLQLEMDAAGVVQWGPYCSHKHPPLSQRTGQVLPCLHCILQAFVRTGVRREQADTGSSCRK